MPDAIQSHPRYGFSEQQMINQILTSSALSGTLTSRAAGTRFAVAIGIYTLVSSSGAVRFFLEGTLDDVNWFVLGQTTTTTDFSATSNVVLNAAGNSLVDLQRFKSIRTRAAVISGTPVFTLQTIVTAISQDAEAFVRTTAFTRSGATPTSVSGTSFPRPQGTMLANVEVVASGVTLNGVTSFDVSLQGSPDGGTTWVTIGTVSVTGNGAGLMLVGGEQLFSLGEYANLRFREVDNGGAGASTAFTITAYLGLDSMDWILEGDSTSGSPFDPSEVFCSIVFATPAAEALDTRTIGFQILDSDGVPISEARKVELILYDTSNAGDVDLASNATFSVVNTGTGIAGLLTNRLVMTTNTSGVGNVSVLDAATETVYLTAVNNRGPSSVAQIIVVAGQASLAFA